ncbi:MAG: cyclic nucleotide-binding domain-containing protein [Bacteroidetes bacterium]|jgi:CRP-like cAMP-binding protein|nr:cyclic nucleotide-binding domain-containing protein [Bacteroidota bacterium]
MISEQLLIKFDAELREYDKEDIIFNRFDHALFYYQIQSGEVKMNNVNTDGKEFIQGIFYPGQSFGEPPLFANVKYPAGAQAIINSKIYRLPRPAFFDLLRAHPEMHFKMSEVLSARLYYKAIMASEISSQEPEHRILRLLDYMKKHIHHLDNNDVYQVDLTRQQIADLTGLRVETVIRACKALEKKHEIKITKRKIFR